MSKDEQTLRLVPKAKQRETENMQRILEALRALVARAEENEFLLIGFVAAKPDGTTATLYVGDLTATADLNLAIDVLKNRVLRHE